MVVAGVAGAIAFQTLFAAIVARSNPYLLNPDAVSYLLIAQHYAKGEFRLALNGYWGPVFSWLTVPLLALGSDPLVAARIVMGLSALVFLLGCVSVFCRLDIRPSGVVAGTWIVAVMCVPWSIENITPDLFMNGLLCFGISRMLSASWVENRRVQFFTGMLLGAAYLTKAVALPVSVALTIAIGTFWILKEPANRRMVSQSVLFTFIGLVLVAGPWIALISAKYRTFVFSTSSKVAHVMIGPPDMERSPGTLLFYTPESGRFSASEDPTSLAYVDWSPFESFEYFKYQLGFIYHNGRKVMNFLSAFDLLRIGLVAALGGLLVHTPWRENITRERWRWSLVLICCMAAFYLPVYAGDERYYYGEYPFLIAASLGMVASLTSAIPGRINVLRLLGIGLVVLSFVQTPLVRIANALRGLDDSPTTLSADLATKLRAAGREGSIAGVGICLDPVPPNFVSFFLNQVYHGCEPNTTLMRIKNSGARLILVDRRLRLIGEMEKDSEFEDLDSLLFNSHESADKFPVKVFQLRTP